MEDARIAIKPEESSLKRISKQVAIINNLLAHSNQDRIIQFLLDNELFFLRLISKHFSFDEHLLTSYADDFDWNGKGISGNPNIYWSKDLIKRLSERLAWRYFSFYSKTPNELLSFKKVDWSGLSQNSNIDWDNDFIDTHISKIDFKSMSVNLRKDWSFDLIEHNKDRWDWEGFSANDKLPWSEVLLEKYFDRWDWRMLSYNKGIPWTIELVEKYKDKWDWQGLCINSSFPWSISLIERYWQKLDFGSLNSGLGLSQNAGLNWSFQLLKRYKNNWSEVGLSKNEGIVWTQEMINEVQSWGYEINPYSNKNSPWSIDYILANRDVIKFYQVYEYETIWQNVFKSVLDYNIVKDILNTIRARRNYKIFAERKQYDKLAPQFLDYHQLYLWHGFKEDEFKAIELCFNKKHGAFQFINSEKTYQDFLNGKLKLSDLNTLLAEANNYDIKFNIRKGLGEKLEEDYIDKYKEIMDFLTMDVTLPEYYNESNSTPPKRNQQNTILNWFKNKFT